MKKLGDLVFAGLMLGGFLSMIGIAVVDLVQAQTTKSRPKVDANKKWELVHDAADQVLASCDSSLKCEVSDQLKQMIACHEQMKQALRALDNQEIMESAELQRIMQECVTTK